MNVTVETEVGGLAAVKLQTPEWEVNIRAVPSDLMKLTDIRMANWDERQSIRAGATAGAPVFWAADGAGVALLVGDDDETWDVSVRIPFAAVEEIVRLLNAELS